MSFDWSEFLDLAQDLRRRASKAPHSEAMYRASISRAYYAAFMKSVDFLSKKGVALPLTGEAHRAVPEAMRQRGAVGNAIARSLLRLKAQRTEADYRQSPRRWDKEAEYGCMTALEILNDLLVCP